MSQLTTQYVNQLKHLHRTTDFGSGGAKVPKVLQPYLSNVKSLLDFGCGKGKFSQTIKDFNSNINVYSYDPVTAPIELPEQVDVVYSSDVLEHVEPEFIDDTLDVLFNIATKYQYHLIACHPAKKKLQDGRNAHLIIKEPKWWKQKLEKYNWTVVFEEVKEKDRFIQGQNIHMVKYIVLLEKNE